MWLLDKKLSWTGSALVLKVAIGICLLVCWSANIFADNGSASSHEVNYVDSLRHGNTIYTDNEIRNLLKYLKELKTTASADSIRKYSVEGMLNFSWYLMNDGMWFLCGDLLNNALRYCPTEDQTLRHQIETAVAGVYLYNGNYDKAGKLLLTANKYFSEHADTVEWLKNCVNVGLYYARIHNRPKALEYYMKVLSIAQKEKKYENYYSIVSGYAERIEEDSIIGLATLEKALRISIDNGYTYLLASNYNELARYYYRMENYHEAIANARKALNYSVRFSQDQMEITACGTLADTYYIQKNYVAAYGMLSRKTDIKEKLQANSGKTYYAHLNMIDSLISWVDQNVPLSINDNYYGEGKKTREFTWLWWVAACLVMTVVGMLIGVRIKRLSDKEVMTPSDSAAENSVSHDDRIEISEANSPNTSELQQIAALNMVADSFNPMLDRIRNMVKEIPKTGDSAVDAQVRGIMNFLLQTRLPERAGALEQAIKKDEEKFAERLNTAYPGLTKNDLRMALYIRCGLSLQEISALSGLQSKSVNQARYRLRKSLGLGQEDSLEGFIATF